MIADVILRLEAQPIADRYIRAHAPVVLDVGRYVEQGDLGGWISHNQRKLRGAKSQKPNCGQAEPVRQVLFGIRIVIQ